MELDPDTKDRMRGGSLSPITRCPYIWSSGEGHLGHFSKGQEVQGRLSWLPRGQVYRDLDVSRVPLGRCQTQAGQQHPLASGVPVGPRIIAFCPFASHTWSLCVDRKHMKWRALQTIWAKTLCWVALPVIFLCLIWQLCEQLRSCFSWIFLFSCLHLIDPIHRLGLHFTLCYRL